MRADEALRLVERRSELANRDRRRVRRNDGVIGHDGLDATVDALLDCRRLGHRLEHEFGFLGRFLERLRSPHAIRNRVRRAGGHQAARLEVRGKTNRALPARPRKLRVRVRDDRADARERKQLRKPGSHQTNARDRRHAGPNRLRRRGRPERIRGDSHATSLQESGRCDVAPAT